MRRQSQREHTREGGFVIFFVFLFSAILIMSLAFAVDMSRATDQQQQIQIAADAAALAAINALGQNPSYSNVLGTVTAIAQANGITSSEILREPPRCGAWNNGSFAANSNSACDSSSTAIEVTINRALPTTFARFLQTNQFDLRARAVSYLPPPANGTCIRPFGVENSYLSRLSRSGDSMVVSGNQGSGNWGKLDIGGNASSGTEYTNLMFNNVCHDTVAPGNSVSAGTGNAQIEQVFQALLDDTTPPYGARGMIFAATSDFGTGNSSVVIDHFIKVDLLSQSGTGSRWRATFRVVDWDATPEPPTPPVRQLMQ